MIVRMPLRFALAIAALLALALLLPAPAEARRNRKPAESSAPAPVPPAPPNVATGQRGTADAAGAGAAEAPDARADVRGPGLGIQVNLTLIVDRAEDDVDTAPGDGRCQASIGGCTVRAAVMEANANAGSHTIVVPVGTFTLTRPGFDSTSVAGDLDVWGAVTLVGQGRGLTILDGNNLDRVVDVLPGAALTLAHLTLQHGRASGGTGGGLRNQGATSLDDVAVIANQAVLGGTFEGNGGGLSNISGGTMDVQNSSVEGNRAIAVGGIGGYGGGIANYNGSQTTLTNTNVSNNAADANGGGITQGSEGSRLKLVSSTLANNSAAAGGGIVSGGSATTPATTFVELVNSTVSGNQARASSGGGITLANAQGHLTVTSSTFTENVNSTAGFSGAGIRIGGPSSTAAIVSSTIVNNTASGGAGLSSLAVNGAPATVTVIGTVLGNDNGSCAGPIVSLGNNADGGTTCQFIAQGDRSNVIPMLSGLTEAGSPTAVLVPQPGSPLIDAIPGCPATDQRGVARPQDGDGNGLALCDVGAVELESAMTCSPRPPVQMAVLKEGANLLRVTVTATGAGNRILDVGVKRSTNAAIQPATLSVGAPSLTFRLTRPLPLGGGASGAGTVQLVVTDRCGQWPTVVGGGSSAW
ncbi:MAG: right-handed parallel beta-helix repeat-containing protein [Chloroflexi bacterium]|nr:right-handed parallel beta-helix repeat-containing protein [Chloroflexota bacterium]